MMNKEELVQSVMTKLTEMGFSAESKAQTVRTVNAVVDTIMESVVEGDGINLVGFGSFKAVDRAARPYRDMQTGEIKQSAAHRTVKFTAGTAFKNAVNE